jgi:hypothetical protein
MFYQDPYGCRVTKATMSIPFLKEAVPLYDYVGRYWNRNEWLRLLSMCADLDFHALGQRQQDKYLPPSYEKIWDTGQSKWIRRRVAKISSSDDVCFNVWIGPWKDWKAVFEFEGNFEGDGSDAECPSTRQANPIEPVPLLPNHDSMDLTFIKIMEQSRWLYLTLFATVFLSLLEVFLF